MTHQSTVPPHVSWSLLERRFQKTSASSSVSSKRQTKEDQSDFSEVDLASIRSAFIGFPHRFVQKVLSMLSEVLICTEDQFREMSVFSVSQERYGSPADASVSSSSCATTSQQYLEGSSCPNSIDSERFGYLDIDLREYGKDQKNSSLIALIRSSFALCGGCVAPAWTGSASPSSTGIAGPSTCRGPSALAESHGTEKVYRTAKSQTGLSTISLQVPPRERLAFIGLDQSSLELG